MSRETFKIGLFAHELVQHIAEFECLYNNKTLNHYKKVTSDSGFDKCIGEAVYLILGQNGNVIYNCYEEMDETILELETEFAFRALDAVPAYFPEGYTPGHCLGYCAMLIGVSLLFLEVYETDTVLVVAADIIQSVLTYFTLISDFDMRKDLPELIRVSRHFCRKLKPRKKK